MHQIRNLFINNNRVNHGHKLVHQWDNNPYQYRQMHKYALHKYRHRKIKDNIYHNN